MAVEAVEVNDGTGIPVLVDGGATGKAQIVKIGYSADGSETKVGADADGLKVNAATVVTALGTIDGHVDGLETLVTSSNTKLDTVNTNLGTIDGHVDGIETLIGSTNTKLDTVNTNLGTIDGRVDGLEGLITAYSKQEDAVAGSGDTGVMALAVRKDAAGADAADGDYAALHVDSSGRLQVSGTQIEDAVANSGDPGTFVLAVRRDSATSGAAAGDYHELQVDSLGRLRTIDQTDEVTPSNSTTTALDNDGPVSKGSAGTLYGFQGYADAAGFVQVHDKASAPASTNVPVIVIPVTANSPFSLDLGRRGRAFANGIAFGFSSTGPTYTDGGSHLWVDVQYV